MISRWVEGEKRRERREGEKKRARDSAWPLKMSARNVAATPFSVEPEYDSPFLATRVQIVISISR